MSHRQMCKCRGPGLETGFRACLWLRSAIRVLVLLAEGDIDTTRPSGQVLYEWARYPSKVSEYANKMDVPCMSKKSNEKS